MSPEDAAKWAAVDKALGLNQPRTTSVSAILSWLDGAGFTVADQLLFTDKPMEYVTLVSRVWKGQHQYVSLVTYEGAFVQLVIQVYAVAFNGRAKGSTRREQEERGKVPVYANAAYCLEELMPQLSRVYPLSLPPKKGA